MDNKEGSKENNGIKTLDTQSEKVDKKAIEAVKTQSDTELDSGKKAEEGKTINKQHLSSVKKQSSKKISASKKENAMTAISGKGNKDSTKKPVSKKPQKPKTTTSKTIPSKASSGTKETAFDIGSMIEKTEKSKQRDIVDKIVDEAFRGCGTLEQTKKWFEKADVSTTDRKTRAVQLGCYIEEHAELLEALSLDKKAKKAHKLADKLKTANSIDEVVGEIHLKELLDALCDIVVTAVGVAHTFGFDISGAMAEVNRSNFSKFENGKVLRDKNGKIAKGKDYTPPNLWPFVNSKEPLC